MGQQPAGTYNVKTQGGATGNGTTNDTTAVQNTLNAANAAGKGVYFPAGAYIVNAITIPDNTSLFGDKSGVSLLKTVQPYKNVNAGVDDADADQTIGDLRIEDMFFLNMRINFPNNAMSNVTMNRCVIATDRIPAGGQGWMMSEWDGDDMVVQDCIFLSGHETGEWLGGRLKAIKVNKATRMLIRRTIIGLDMGNFSWLASEWQGYPNWTKALGRLTQFKTEQNIPRRMGEMAGGIAIFDGTENVIDQNIIHLDFEANLAGGLDEDHLIYSLRETKIEITRNWLSGLPNTAGGGLKHRDTWGPGVIAANYLNDAPLLLYSYGDANSVPIDYDYLFPFDNQLVFRNYLKVTSQRVLGNAITGGSSRYGFNFLKTDSYTGRNIDVAENLFDLSPSCPNQSINLAQGGTGADEWRIYRDNYCATGANGGNLVEITGRNTTPGAYTYYTALSKPAAPYLSDMNATMAKYEAMDIPYLNIPLYGEDPVLPGYAIWLEDYPSIAGAGPETDSDMDGMSNLMEYALGGNPIIRDATTELPKVESAATGAKFTLRRSDRSETDTRMTFQCSDNLSEWKDVVIGATSSEPNAEGVRITLEENGSLPDLIQITLPVSETCIFGRFQVSAMP
jgi:hypothetical protein